MDSKHIAAPLASALLLLACEPAQDPRQATNATASPAAAPEAAPALPAPPAGTPPTDATPPAADAADFSPPVLTPQAERGVKGARNVLLSFARAIEQKQFGQAWALLSPADQGKWGRRQFAEQFTDLADITVAIPDGEMEGAAGSSYYTAPVTITARDRQGRPVRIEGKAVLRRVNDVDGATPAQLRWHFETLTLDWTH